MYRISTIGNLFDGAPLPPIDPSWLPPGTVQGPDGRLVPAPPPPSRSPSVAAILAAAAAGGAIVFVVTRRARR